MARKFAPSLQRLINLALGNQDVFNVLTPLERQVKDASKTKVVLVQRLSKTDEKKASKGRQHSIRMQIRACETYAKRKGYTIVASISDVDATGGDFLHRPRYQTLRRKLVRHYKGGKNTYAQKLIFYLPDRFARNLKEALVEMDDLGDIGVALEFSELPIDTSTPWGRFQLKQFFLQAEFELEMLKYRTREGVAQAREEGRHVGHWPKHFKRDTKGRIIPTKTARDVCNQRIAGTGWRTIAKDLGITISEARNVIVYVSKLATVTLET